MRLGASIGRADPATLIRRATDYESAGIDVLWVAELYGFDGPSPILDQLYTRLAGGPPLKNSEISGGSGACSAWAGLHKYLHGQAG